MEEQIKKELIEEGDRLCEKDISKSYIEVHNDDVDKDIIKEKEKVIQEDIPNEIETYNTPEIANTNQNDDINRYESDILNKCTNDVNIDSHEKDNNTIDKPVNDKSTNDESKPKDRTAKRFKIEIHIDVNEDGSGEFDAFSDNNNVYKKYKLRQQREKPQQNSEEIPKRNVNKKKHKKNTEADLLCLQCNKEFENRVGLNNHMRIHDVPQVFTCALCAQSFDTNKELVTHKVIHADENFTCSKCKFAFSDHYDYLVHELMTHCNRNLYNCAECSLTFSKKGVYKSHLFCHFNKKSKCPICNRNIRDDQLKSHMESHNKTISCVECGKIYKCEKSYKYHLTTHTGVKKCQCLYCGKGFGNNAQKVVHTRIHTNERPYECKICLLRFKQTADLKRHSVTHDEKKHQCDVCKKKFWHIEYLKSHMGKHLNVNLYSCDECGESFHYLAGLRSHQVYKHTKERPFHCVPCNMGFKVRGQLTRHEESRFHRNKCYGVSLKTKGEE